MPPWPAEAAPSTQACPYSAGLTMINKTARHRARLCRVCRVSEQVRVRVRVCACACACAVRALRTDANEARDQGRGDFAEQRDAGGGSEKAEPKEDQGDHAHEREPGSLGL